MSEPTYATVNIGAYNSGGIVSLSPMDTFQKRSPRASNDIKAIKLTKSNLKAIAGEIAKAGKDVVWIDDDNFEVSQDDHDTIILASGDWVVEDYDYDLGATFFRFPDSDERRQYDLR